MNDFSKTIAAVSTPRGKGGIAVIRLSGPDAAAVAARMFRPKSGKALADCAPRTAVFGAILDAADEICDEGIATLFRAPHSFTGEDVAEIACHGGPAVTEAVFLSAVAHGAVAAGPGEFTRRAFVNGRLSLTEAEAVGRLIDADTAERLALSSGALRGNVSREIARIADGLLATMTALYAAIDYP
ncbi:MAG: tRNA uridine-5-carboxymethylaminomethyl(34) synthesis GTPase MnmE, partial [Clostridia bacterium]|nr:tRNA uridine-5-carboxymethylaminomethyl(34) synthesis GTPase MnmE [Clostridia bacterium]